MLTKKELKCKKLEDIEIKLLLAINNIKLSVDAFSESLEIIKNKLEV